MADISSRSLLIHPSPNQCEGPLAYALRLTEENAFPNVLRLLAWLSIGKSEALEIGPAGIHLIAQGHLVDEIPKAHNIAVALHNAGLSPFETKVCPKCLAARSICQKNWDIGHTLFCITHNIRLLAHCHNCRRPITTLRVSPRICGCKANFAQAPTTEAPDWAHEYQRQFVEGPFEGSVRESPADVYRERALLLYIKSTISSQDAELACRTRQSRRIRMSIDDSDYQSLQAHFNAEHQCNGYQTGITNIPARFAA